MQSCPSLDKTILRLKGVDNNTDTFSTLGKFKLNISLPEENLYFPFHVVEKIHLSYDGIIGNDILYNYHGKIDYNKNELDLNKNIIKLKFSEPTYNIAARTEAVIECTVENPEIKEGMITDQRVSESLLIANCIVKVRDNNRVIISIANISEEPVTINSNLNLRILPLESSSSISLDTNPNSINSCLHRTNKVLDLLRTSHLNQEESIRLFDLCSNFSDIFHIPDEKLSHTQTLEHQIVTTSPYPIHVKSYRFPEIHKKEVQIQVDKMLDQNIISPSTSPWTAPIWIVPKKIDASGEKKWRIVIDYRKLNDITIGDTYPIPNITEILDQLGKSKYFSTLDLASGFHQIKMSPEDAVKTAFSVPQGHFQFNRMPFGLKNAHYGSSRIIFPDTSHILRDSRD